MKGDSTVPFVIFKDITYPTDNMYNDDELKRILGFDEFVNEKMGVIERMTYEEYDVKETSKIINDFMSNIIKRRDEVYKKHYLMFDRSVTIIYEPHLNPDDNGYTDNGTIYIYKQVDEDNYLDVKYTLAHELVHMIHQILSDNERPYDELSNVEKIRYKLIRNSGKSEKCKYLNLLLYLIDRNEVFSRNQNAYITAYKYKTKHPDSTNQEVLSYTLDRIKMSKNNFDSAMDELECDEDVFTYVIAFMIGNFFEFGKGGYQRYFDRSVFKIPVVKRIRHEIKEITHNCFYLDRTCLDIIELVKRNITELDSHRDEIVGSFVGHVKYWFDNARKRLGKAIQLGIDDAVETI